MGRTLTHDGLNVYERFSTAIRQQCLAHLSRRCQELVETARGGAVHFPREVLDVIDRAYAVRRLWRGHRIDADEQAVQGLAFACELEQLYHGRFRKWSNQRLSKHILKHAMSWFWCLIDLAVQSTNH